MKYVYSEDCSRSFYTNFEAHQTGIARNQSHGDSQSALMTPAGCEWYDKYATQTKGSGLESLNGKSGKSGLERNSLTWNLNAQSVVLRSPALASLGACWKCRMRLHFNEMLHEIHMCIRVQ